MSSPKQIIFLLAVCLLSTATGLAQADVYLPQVADGQGAGLTIRTTFILFNPTERSAGVEISLTDDDGNPFVVALGNLEPSSSFSLSLSAGQTLLLETSGQGALRTGAATVNATESLGVSAIFTILNSQGVFVTEAGVGPSTALTEFVIPVDTTGSFNTGLALLNVGNLETNLTFQLFQLDGTPGGTANLTLPGQSHRAKFVSGAGELFASVGQFQGTMRVTSTRPVAAVVLRQNLAVLTSTTLPIVPANTQLTSFSLPQIANGTYAGGSVRTTFVVFNPGDQAADVQFNLTRDDGTPLVLNVAGASQAAFARTIPARGSAFLSTDGGGPLAAGAARVTSNRPIGVSALFTLFDTAGQFATEAGVGDSPAVPRLTVPLDTTGQFDTGLAVFNPSSSFPATVTLRLLDPSGTRLGTAEVQLPPLGHSAVMMRQVFPGQTLRGSISATADAPISALTIRLNAVPLSYTTLPRTPETFVGFEPRQALLTQNLSAVPVTEGTAVDATLQQGFFLTGSVSGTPALVVEVTAVSTENQVFLGSFDSTRNEYRIAVPEGNYFLRVCYRPQSAPVQGAVTLTIQAPDKLVVNADRRFDYAIPEVTLRQVSGRVTGLGQMPVMALLTFTRPDALVQAQSLISLEGDYSAQLPEGNYVTSLSVTILGNQLGLYNIGPLNVGGDVSANFALPSLSTLLGTVQLTGRPIVPFGSFISATDSSAPPVQPGQCNVPPAFSTLNVGLDGRYQATLQTGRTYTVQANVKLQTGVLAFPIPPATVNLTGNIQQDFSLPAIPDPVGMTGVVRDSSGNPVAGVEVLAVGENPTGLPGSRFSATTVTNLRGEYSLQLLPGTYTFSFVPER